MANKATSEYWTWSDSHQDYFHGQRHPTTGQWEYTWGRESSIPRTPYVPHPAELPSQPEDPPPQPVDPYGARAASHERSAHASLPPQPVDPYGARAASHERSAHASLRTGSAAITQALSQLSVRGGQTSDGRSRQTNYHQSQPAGTNRRSDAPGHRGTSSHNTGPSSIVIEPSQTTRSGRSYTYSPLSPYSNGQPSYGNRDATSFRDVGPAVGRQPAQGLGYQTQWQSPNQSTGAYNTPQTRHAGQESHSRQSQLGEPSQELQTSNRLEINNSLLIPYRVDALDPKEFKQITNKRKKFFVVGKVFMMLYIENAGQTADRGFYGGTNFTTVAHGEVAHHQFRRFVVVQEKSRQDFCYCCPITTYGNRATTKPGVDQASHTIVYSGRDPPTKLAGETRMNKDPLKIILHSPDDKLDPKSRINLARAYPIEHNVKVKDIGHVEERSLPRLVAYHEAARRD